MSNLQLDKNYNTRTTQKHIYHDKFGDMADSIIQAHSDKVITEKEMAVLLGIALRKELKTEFRSVISMEGTPEKQTMFLQFTSQQIKNA